MFMKLLNQTKKYSWFSLLFFPLFAKADSHDVEGLTNPLALDSIQDLLEAIVNIFQIIATPIVVFFIIYSGFLYVTARGNTETLDKAKKALIYAVIGGVVIIGSIALGTIVENTANEFRP